MENLDYKIFNYLDTELESIWKSFEKDSHNFIFQKYDFIKDYTINRKSQYFFIVIYLKKRLSVFYLLKLKINLVLKFCVGSDQRNLITADL